MRFAFVAALFVACGNPSVLDKESYANDCTMSSECVAVFLGDQCEPCACPNAAISSREKLIYEADRSSAIAACDEVRTLGCGPCPTIRASCQRVPNAIMETPPTFCGTL